MKTLPARWILGACHLLGYVLWALAWPLRRQLAVGVRQALGGEAPSSRQILLGLADLLADTLALLRSSTAKDHGLILEPSDRWRLTTALAAGKGVIVATAHFGPWERAGAMLAEAGFPFVVVARESYDARFHSFYDELRSRYGVRVLYRGQRGFTTAVVRALRRGDLVAFAVDLPGRGVRTCVVPWWGVPRATPLGPATLALRTGAVLMVGTPVPDKGYGGRRLTFEHVDRADPPGALLSAETLTARLVSGLTRRIAQEPTAWLWPPPT